MNEHFIKNIEIKNFKCFKDFKAKGFKRVNLIGGKNNVGKTAFMEACYVNSNSIGFQDFLTTLYNIELNREKTNLLSNTINDIVNNSEDEILKNIFSFQKLIEKKELLKKKLSSFDWFEIKTNLRKNNFKNKTDINTSFLLSINDRETELNSFENLNLNLNYNSIYIENIGISTGIIKKFYDVIQENDDEELFSNYLKNFDKDLEKFKFINSLPKLRKNGKYQELRTFGDGLKLYLSIVISLLVTKKGFIFIDEIDNGIHYSLLDNLWEIILTISKKQNVQVFATTHSKECIESYARVSKKLQDEEITMTTLAINPKGELKALELNAGMFYSELEQNHEVRGW